MDKTKTKFEKRLNKNKQTRWNYPKKLFHNKNYRGSGWGGGVVVVVVVYFINTVSIREYFYKGKGNMECYISVFFTFKFGIQDLDLDSLCQNYFTF